MKKFKISTALLLAYCIGCFVVIVCMLLSHAYYPTAFSNICFKIGAVFFLLTGLNPMGLVCSIINICLYYDIGFPRSKGTFVWLFAAPILATLCWYLSLSFFVSYSGA